LYETNYSMDDTEIRLSLPVTKVDVERRTVYGFATLDNLDKQNDIVPLDASIKAFEKFRGNIREQHDPKKAVGKMISFKPENIYDKDTGKVYSGVFVSAYISRGAQDTWEKVLDGTLSGFSIGGSLKETRNVYDEELGKMIRVVDDYEMIELSLVDTPANPLANVTIVHKVGGVLEGMELKGELETIFMCHNDSVVKVSKDGNIVCPICNNAMSDVGFVESNDVEKAGIINTMVSKFLGNTKAKEAKEMAEQNETEVVEKSEVDVPAEAPEEVVVVEEAEDAEATEPVADAVEKAEEVVEAPAEEVAKADDQSNAVNELLIESLNSVVKTLEALSAQIQGVEKSVTGRLDKVESTVNKTTESVEEFGKRVDKVEDTTAFRKSGDLGEVAQERVEKTESLWKGTFLTVSDL
jgi:uncharacterized Zn finger protein (UPF0148 family)